MGQELLTTLQNRLWDGSNGVDLPILEADNGHRIAAIPLVDERIKRMAVATRLGLE